jgi:hypothetical protein
VLSRTKHRISNDLRANGSLDATIKARVDDVESNELVLIAQTR